MAKTNRKSNAAGTKVVRDGRRQPSPKAAPSRELKLLLLIGVPILLIFGALVAVNSRDDAGAGMTPAQRERLIREDSPVLGPADAPVAIVEFLDPECESCRAAAPIVKRLLGEYDGRVRLVVRYFPLHANSVLARTRPRPPGSRASTGRCRSCSSRTSRSGASSARRRPPPSSSMPAASG